MSQNGPKNVAPFFNLFFFLIFGVKYDLDMFTWDAATNAL